MEINVLRKPYKWLIFLVWSSLGVDEGGKMKIKFDRAVIAFPILILFVGISCSWAGNSSASGSTSLKPQAGAWKAALDIQREEGNDEHWGLSFIVSNDGKQITQAQGAHYYGELTADTQVSVDMDINIPEKIINNSFTLSFKELRGFSISTYTFEGTFLSAVEAKGTVTILSTEYSWIAAPTTQSGTPERTTQTESGIDTTPEIGTQTSETATIPSDTPTVAPTLTQRVKPMRGVIAIAVGGQHSCAVMSNGGLKCWGSNESGQLGNGTTTDSSVPVEVSGLLSGVTAVAASSSHTCALMSSGGVKCWGLNLSGELGTGTTTDSLLPVDVSGLSSGVTAIAASDYNTCALTSEGGVLCWGHNYFGELGDGTTTDSSVPVNVGGLSHGVIAIAMGNYYACALLSTGGIKCWGSNSFGGLGDGTLVESSHPVDVTGLSSGATALALGSNHTCALMNGGGVKCWGDNSDGQVGNGMMTEAGVLKPTDVSGLSGVVTAIAAGGYIESGSTCALILSGGVECWGDNISGQLGNGTTTGSSVPVDVSGMSGIVTAIDLGYFHTCALTSDGGVKCWGYNYYGQLGDGTKTDSSVPVDVVM
jgi:alpha-tubulin suppressor-like RCC1 family protein